MEGPGNLEQETKTCKADATSRSRYRETLPQIIDSIVDSCQKETRLSHISPERIPSRQAVKEILSRTHQLLFPGYFSRENIDPVNLNYEIGSMVTVLFELLARQITHSFRHQCFRYSLPCVGCEEKGYQEAVTLLLSIPGLQKILSTDVMAAYEGDPAAGSSDEIIFSYPGILAISIYRIAHQLYKQEIPLLPRMMTEYAHSITGIDIHPGATSGESFFIDHGTGVVIGETTEIGKGVRIYQGVTLGALSLPKDAGEQWRGKKRHPTIEDDVILYSGATILGGDTTIGARSTIGGNVWITESVPPDTRVIMEEPRLHFK
ncbi:serine O-acetyltransferase EpsC [Syntrophus buswellii]|uniref:serine O-acetyltransferase EpsC n=1 Tax=Syntrophus buswellii TaxID=43774 RepID=UPI0038D41CF2